MVERALRQLMDPFPLISLKVWHELQARPQAESLGWRNSIVHVHWALDWVLRYIQAILSLPTYWRGLGVKGRERLCHQGTGMWSVWLDSLVRNFQIQYEFMNKAPLTKNRKSVKNISECLATDSLLLSYNLEKVCGQCHMPPFSWSQCFVLPVRAPPWFICYRWRLQ